jgi:hypothetical protein
LDGQGDGEVEADSGGVEGGGDEGGGAEGDGVGDAPEELEGLEGVVAAADFEEVGDGDGESGVEVFLVGGEGAEEVEWGVGAGGGFGGGVEEGEGGAADAVDGAEVVGDGGGQKKQ